MVDEVRIERDVLYDAVWRTPLSRLGVEWRLSGDQIAQACRDLRVPRPEQGYWQRAREEAGEPPPLPALEPGGLTEVVIVKRAARPLVDAEAERTGNVKPHPLVAKTSAALRREKPAATGLLHPDLHAESLSVHVTPGLLDRALNVLNQLCRSVESAGGKVAIKHDANGRCVSELHVDGEVLTFSLSERVKSHRPPVTPEIASSVSRRLQYRANLTISYIPTGQLLLELRGLEGTGQRQKWDDSAVGKLEDKLAHFADDVRAGARVLRERRGERAREERAGDEAREQERRAAEQEAERRREEHHALRLCRKWRRARQLRRFLSAVEASVPENARDPALVDWMRRAAGHADRLDPLLTPAKANRVLPWKGKAR